MVRGIGVKANDGMKSAYKKYAVISLSYVDYIPPSLPALTYNTKMVFVQDSDAVQNLRVQVRPPTELYMWDSIFREIYPLPSFNWLD